MRCLPEKLWKGKNKIKREETQDFLTLCLPTLGRTTNKPLLAKKITGFKGRGREDCMDQLKRGELKGATYVSREGWVGYRKVNERVRNGKGGTLYGGGGITSATRRYWVSNKRTS